MTPRRFSPTLLIALAIAAALSTAGAAEACSTAPATTRTKGCCAVRTQVGCGCCGIESEAVEPSRTAPPALAIAAHSQGDSPTCAAASVSCECRASEPAGPSDRPQASPRVEKTAAAPAVATLPLPSPRTTPDASARPLDPDSRPVYLRTSRLRI